jgi:hypothetical protein
MYPDSYVVLQLNVNSTVSTAAATVKDIDNPLMPFACHDSGIMHTARTVRDTSSPGYAYSEL